MKLIVACATDNGHTLTNEHFGSARQYAIYELNEAGCTYLHSLTNTVNEEKEEHADPQKAKNVTALLSDAQVQVVAAKRFGPNISRIKQPFVPIIIKTDSLEDGCAKLLENRDAIVAELRKGEARSFLLLS